MLILLLVKHHDDLSDATTQQTLQSSLKALMSLLRMAYFSTYKAHTRSSKTLLDTKLSNSMKYVTSLSALVTERISLYLYVSERHNGVGWSGNGNDGSVADGWDELK